MEGPSLSPPPPSGPAAEPVYRLAGSLGSELQRLSALVGPGAVAGLVAQVVRLLELLEAWAQDEPGLRAAAEQKQQQQQQQQGQAEEPEKPEEEPEEEQPGPGSPQGGGSALLRLRLREEREVMLRLKEVVDRQRDQIRAQDHQIRCKARDAEALQEQLERFMAVNQELHRKLAVAQAQLRSALERKQDLEGELRQAQALQGDRAQAPPTPPAQAEESPASPGDPGPAGNAFSREELRQILQERNELKTSLFLVQEELAYYQRELLNHGRIPSLLLQAVKANVRKQRKKIRAKMLGTAEEEPLSSQDEEEEEEEGEWLAGTPGPSDCVDSRLPGSTIKSFFGQWYGRGSRGSPPDAWEIVDPQELGLPQEEEQEKQPEGGGREGQGGPPAPP